MDPWHTKIFYQNLIVDLIDLVDSFNRSVLPDPDLSTISILNRWSEFWLFWVVFLYILYSNLLKVNDFIRFFKCFINFSLHPISGSTHMDMRRLHRKFVFSYH